MLKKTMTYTNFDGVEITEDFYFNFTEAELMEMETSTSGGMAETIQKIIKSKNVQHLMTIFKDLIIKAYGVKSADGKMFIKNDQVRAEFVATQAYSDLYMELATNDEAAIEFVNEIMPKKASDKNTLPISNTNNSDITPVK